ncbi:GGDEF domain-containing protein [Roseibium aggregatum]|uniref:GGDEF domain-containing protein n=1 Tax=Roseibium aggregatum TaxID=187304 RepID=UPI002E2BF980|nr:GGDEF domain-containing protein [Roseibium aggregatum]
MATMGAALLLLASVAALDVLIDWQVDAAIKEEAEIRALNWAENFYRTTPSARRMIGQGITTRQEAERLENSFALVGVVRFEMFDDQGMITLLSDMGGPMPEQLFNELALSVHESGEPQVAIVSQTGAAAPEKTYAQVYLPAVLPSGENIGTLEVLVDVSNFRQALQAAFKKTGGLMVAGTAVFLLVPVVIYVHRTRQLRHKDRQLLELTRYDQLTGTLNRNSISQIFDDHFENSETPLNLGILFVDIDYFKQVNDQFGHVCGDLLLQQIAHALKACLRGGGDAVGRFGGDEFVLLLPEISLKDFRCLYGRVMEKATSPKDVSGAIYAPSLSIGAYLAVTGDTGRLALHRADLAVYAAKRRGRSQIVEYSEELEGLFEQEDILKIA